MSTPHITMRLPTFLGSCRCDRCRHPEAWAFSLPHADGHNQISLQQRAARCEAFRESCETVAAVSHQLIESVPVEVGVNRPGFTACAEGVLSEDRQKDVKESVLSGVNAYTQPFAELCVFTLIPAVCGDGVYLA